MWCNKKGLEYTLCLCNRYKMPPCQEGLTAVMRRLEITRMISFDYLPWTKEHAIPMGLGWLCSWALLVSVHGHWGSFGSVKLVEIRDLITKWLWSPGEISNCHHVVTFPTVREDSAEVSLQWRALGFCLPWLHLKSCSTQDKFLQGFGGWDHEDVMK